MDINIDTYDWSKNKDVVIINGVITDRRLMGSGVQAPSYTFARNACDYGSGTCELCGVFYAKTKTGRHMGNHLQSRKHMESLKGETPIKRRVRLY